MASWALAPLILIVIVGAVLVFTNSSVISTLIQSAQHLGGGQDIVNNLFPSASAALNSCTSQVNDFTRVISERSPAGSEIAIVNVTMFSYNQNTNITFDQILSWAKNWSSKYTSTHELPPFIQSDAANAAIGDNVTRHSGIGEVIKLTIPPGDFATGAETGSKVTPVLCDLKGNLLPGSRNNTVWS
ncbi:MAG: hypothetical protein KGH94_04165 [Candidatus Micrarchaeota archaeon]|nr:hypothetical protein [Candidatus Micrarchaeota archaeon]